MIDIPQKIKQTLRDFGLSKAEMYVYVSALRLGAQPASVIAKHALLKRGHTYNMLTSLKEKGLVQEMIKRKIRHFAACRPETILSVLLHREEKIAHQKEQIAQIIPLLQSLKNPAVQPARVRFFEGSQGIKEIYEDTIQNSNETIYAIGDFACFFPQEKDPVLNGWIWKYSQRRAAKGIWYYGIANKSKYSDMAFRKRLKQKRKLKMLKDVELPVEINIYGNKVAVMSTSKEMIGFIIEDAPTAETLRNLHKAIWGFLPDYAI